MRVISELKRMMDRQFIRFLSVGMINTFVGHGIIFATMYLLQWPPELSNIVGYSVGLILSFTLSKTFTFRSNGALSAEAIRFLIVFAISYSANLIVLSFSVRILGWHAVLSQITAAAFYVFCSYFLNKRFVFLTEKQVNE